MVGYQTPLLLAAQGNHVDVMKALVAAGADPKAFAQDGSNVLMAAANSGHVEAVEYAYELNPDIKAFTESKSTVMHAAVTGSTQTPLNRRSAKSFSSSRAKARTSTTRRQWPYAYHGCRRSAD